MEFLAGLVVSLSRGSGDRANEIRKMRRMEVKGEL